MIHRWGTHLEAGTWQSRWSSPERWSWRWSQSRHLHWEWTEGGGGGGSDITCWRVQTRARSAFRCVTCCRAGCPASRSDPLWSGGFSPRGVRSGSTGGSGRTKSLNAHTHRKHTETCRSRGRQQNWVHHLRWVKFFILLLLSHVKCFESADVITQRWPECSFYDLFYWGFNPSSPCVKK